jgi:hypothetical protein
VSHDNREERQDEMKKQVESTAKQKTTFYAREKKKMFIHGDCTERKISMEKKLRWTTMASNDFKFESRK